MKFCNIILLSLVVIFTGCLKESSLKVPFLSYTQRELNDGWIISEPETEKINKNALNSVYNYIHENQDIWQIRSLLVIRNNKLIAESYTKANDDINTPTAAWSCTKQVIGILSGIALEQGYIENIEDPICKYLPEIASRHPEKSQITFSELLMMKSGIGFDNDGGNGQTEQLLRSKPDNSIEFIFALPMWSPPGQLFHYNDGDPNLISAIIQSRVEMPVKLWADKALFSKLGITNYDWASYKDGVTFGGFGLMITPREMCKIAQCVLNEGTYNGNEIVSRQWIKTMT